MANILFFTEQFENAYWSPSGAELSVTANTAAAPAFAGGSAGLADTVADVSAAATASFLASETIAADGTDWVLSVYIKKDAVTTRFPSLVFQLINGTSITGGVSVNTSTGAIADYTGGAPVTKGIVDVDALWWRVWCQLTNNGTNTAARVVFFPVQANSLGGGFDSTLTGSVIMWGMNISNNTTVQTYQPDPPYSFANTLGWMPRQHISRGSAWKAVPSGMTPPSKS